MDFQKKNTERKIDTQSWHYVYRIEERTNRMEKKEQAHTGEFL